MSNLEARTNTEVIDWVKAQQYVENHELLSKDPYTLGVLRSKGVTEKGRQIITDIDGFFKSRIAVLEDESYRSIAGGSVENAMVVHSRPGDSRD